MEEDREEDDAEEPFLLEAFFFQSAEIPCHRSQLQVGIHKTLAIIPINCQFGSLVTSNKPKCNVPNTTLPQTRMRLVELGHKNHTMALDSANMACFVILWVTHKG